jgi:hypothetical protein
MRPLRLVASVLPWLAIPAVAHAQRPPSADSVPRKGEWAVEGVIGQSGIGASLLRFFSSRTALAVGAEFAAQSTQTDTDLPGFPVDRSYTNASARLGMRSYRNSSIDRLRPIIGAGAIGGYNRATGDFTTWRVGAFGELGAAYFIVPHVSLGGGGEIQLTYQKEKQGSSTTTRNTATTKSVAATIARFAVAVYF